MMMRVLALALLIAAPAAAFELPLPFKYGDVTVAQVWPPIFDVRDLELPLSSAANAPRLKMPRARLAGLELTAPTASLTAPKAMTVKDFRAKLAQVNGQLAVEAFSASAYGGTAKGSLIPGASGPPELKLELSGIRMAQVTGRPGSETLTASLAGPLPADLASFRAKGRATLTGLSTDLRSDPTLRRMDAKAARGQRTASMIGALVPDDALRGLASAFTGAGQASYYRSVIAGLRRRWDLGSASGPLTIANGVATIAPFAGAKVGGKVSMNLLTTRLSGYLSRVNLGRVTLQSVSISGTAGSPGYSVNQNKVLVDGRRPDTRGPSIERELPRALIGHALRRRGGGLIGGLLGGF